MSTWKLTIKPDSKAGHDPFVLCKNKSLLGIGWSGAYENEQASCISEARRLVEKRYSKWPYAVRKLLEEVKEGDHVWLHQRGHYYLCRAHKDIVLGTAIDQDFMSYDLGHARKADWVKVPEVFVSGAVQRGTIAQRMIQKIKITSEERKCHEVMFNKLFANPNWIPSIDMPRLRDQIVKMKMYELFAIMTPDEVEDVIATYLQSEGWYLIKSTCFRSKPVFEFTMFNKQSETCHVQVKSGRHPDPLPPMKYNEYVADKKLVCLFSTNRNAYPGESVKGVNCLSHEEIYTWIIDNSWSLTEPLKQKLWIYLCEQG
ncbi:hypothetical protein BIT28_12405 [Photobacterium proteolyticum]|uniref:Restriction endonuclease type IV Mrr domain-containing protein n=1 Tax=Photobacterium proteolyticum TaxID=1903952 RepID=A0A1Q9GJG4_9GAMM|nr:hypothetical protein [Photobacterium proteolyticum]OLQ74637.1 hypothetical protein BIT28_12405 [Photobacterium proteolyticum]